MSLQGIRMTKDVSKVKIKQEEKDRPASRAGVSIGSTKSSWTKVAQQFKMLDCAYLAPEPKLLFMRRRVRKRSCS